jgi:hypothetical protein
MHAADAHLFSTYFEGIHGVMRKFKGGVIFSRFIAFLRPIFLKYMRCPPLPPPVCIYETPVLQYLTLLQSRYQIEYAKDAISGTSLNSTFKYSESRNTVNI